jgi:hypothetical protein
MTILRKLVDAITLQIRRRRERKRGHAMMMVLFGLVRETVGGGR